MFLAGILPLFILHLKHRVQVTAAQGRRDNESCRVHCLYRYPFENFVLSSIYCGRPYLTLTSTLTLANSEDHTPFPVP